MNFKLKVFCPDQGLVWVQVDASDRAEAFERATRDGRVVISASRQWTALGAGVGRDPLDVALFSQELLALLEAGLSLIESIDLLARKARPGASRRVLDALATHLREGLSFSRAMESLPGSFPTLYVATVRSAEHTGDLAQALQRFLGYHQQMHAVRAKVVAALVYPVLLLGVGALVVAFLLGYVVPRFSLVYADSGRDLPWLSQLLMAWGQFVSTNKLMLAAGTLLVLVGLGVGLSRPLVRAALAGALWRIPALGERLRLYQLARFTRTLAMLLRGGIAFVTALEMAGRLLDQPALQAGVAQAVCMVREGRTVSDSFAAHALATEVGVRLLAVGERTGELGLSMERIAKLYDDDLARWIDWFSKLFEPILMMAIGLVIGAIVVLMYLPIFELANSIQ